MKVPNLFIFIPAFLLSLLSLVTLLSISINDFNSQIVFLIIALLLYFLISQIDIEFMLPFSPIFYLIVNTLLILVLFFSNDIRGSHRWIIIGNIRLQPSELIRPSIILLFSYLSTKIQKLKTSKFFFLTLLLGISSFLVFTEPDLGSTIVIFSLGIYLILNLKPTIQWLITITLFSILFLPISYKFLKPYQIARIETFLNFEKDPLGSSYNQIQAIIAAGSGQLLGKGLGRGTQSHLEFLPEKHTDFFFSAFAEEFGFIGSALVIYLYFMLSFHLIKLSYQADDVYLKLIFLGAFFAIFFQTVLHISINIGLLPVTGITLPFMSSGGSSMISLWLILGIASSAAHKIKKNYAIYLK